MQYLPSAIGNIETINQDTGVGVYGFNCQQLEQAGLIKPGYCNAIVV
jgi:hypothetical protein